MDNSKDCTYQHTVPSGPLSSAELQQLSSAGMATLMQTMYQLVMEAERRLHLDQHPQDKGNGSYPRQLGTPAGTISLQVPRDRDGDFRPQILPPPRVRDVPERSELIEALFTSSYSPNTMATVLSRLGMHYSSDQLQELKKHYLEEFQAWATKQLPQDALAIYIDAWHTEMRQGPRVRSAVCFVVLGVDYTGKKDLWGLYVHSGNENKDYWLMVLNDLIDRGLKRVLYVVSDDFSGLTDAVSTLFPLASHQLCLVHLQRNIRRNVSPQHARRINAAIRTLKNTPDPEQAEQQFRSLLEPLAKRYPAFVEHLLARTKHYLAFTHLHPDLRKYFYTTNAAESFNSLLEKIRVGHGGFFQSEQSLKINIYLTYLRVKQKRWKKPCPGIVANLYHCRQLFAQRYGEQPREHIAA